MSNEILRLRLIAIASLLSEKGKEDDAYQELILLIQKLGEGK